MPAPDKPHLSIVIMFKVDGDTSTNDCVIALASGVSGLAEISAFDCDEALQLQTCLDAVRFSYIFCHKSTLVPLFS